MLDLTTTCMARWCGPLAFCGPCVQGKDVSPSETLCQSNSRTNYNYVPRPLGIPGMDSVSMVVQLTAEATNQLVEGLGAPQTGDPRIINQSY